MAAVGKKFINKSEDVVEEMVQVCARRRGRGAAASARLRTICACVCALLLTLLLSAAPGLHGVYAAGIHRCHAHKHTPALPPPHTCTHTHETHTYSTHIT